jgi:hypothetical protein
MSADNIYYFSQEDSGESIALVKWATVLLV